MKKSRLINITLIILFLLFVGVSYLLDYDKGQMTGVAFLNVLLEMMKILPCVFILIGLFEVWVKKETIIKHLGDEGGINGYLWVLLLAGVSVGGLFVAFPLAIRYIKKEHR